MIGPLYPAARAFAPRLEEHFARHAANRLPGAASPPPLPDAAAIEAIINAGFWASLQREEGHPAEISLAFLPPEQAVRPLLFAKPLPLGPRALVRLAPAVERPGIHLGVWGEGQTSTSGVRPASSPRFRSSSRCWAPGLLVVKHRLREESAKFRNVAVFEGEEVKLLRQDPTDVSDYPALFTALFGPETTSERRTTPSTCCCGSPSRCAPTAGEERSSWSPGGPTPGVGRSCSPSPTPWSRRSRSSPTSSASRTTGGSDSAGWWKRSRG